MALVGNLKDLKLTNIIQINCIERNVARVMVKNGDQQGYIYFSGGEIVHAEFGAFVGEQAVHEMLALMEGEFKVESGITAPTRTINQPWNSIVLEGLRLIDERKIKTQSVPHQLLSGIKSMEEVQDVIILDYNGKRVEGPEISPEEAVFFAFARYKVRKMLNLFYADIFQYIHFRTPDNRYFIFDYRPNIVLIRTGLKVVVGDFARRIKKILKQLEVSGY